MTAPAGADIDIALDLAEDRVVGVRIVPRRLPPIGALVAGRPAAEMLKLVPRLFTLCATAHGAAAQTAVDAARGISVPAALRRQRSAAVLAERLVEQLRGLVIASELLKQGAVVTAMRELIAAAAAFAPAADPGIPGRLGAISRIELALDQIGVGRLDLAESPAARFSFSGTASLSDGKDREVIARLARDGADYTGAPDLDGVVPETGSWARLRADAGNNDPPGVRAETAAARFQARRDEIVRIPGMLRKFALDDDDLSPADRSVIGYGLGEGGGAAAVETARGRLYHHVELDADGRVSRFQCLAPTEWNFHPRGPLARMLRGSTVALDRGGPAAVEQLVAAFDPCVGYRVTIREFTDA